MKILSPSRLVALVAVVAMVLTLGVTFATAGADKAGSTGAKEAKACVHGTALLERNKHNVVGYYTTAFNDKNPELAVKLYGGAEYIQHNPLAANGFAAFIDFVHGFAATHPDLHIDIRRVIAECDLVVTHSVLQGAKDIFGQWDAKVVDIFRLDEHGKIVEHWDVLASISDPANSANGNPEV
jgi:predicted SnoaL-like aldol condensation-catalyzing enzyme